MTQRAPTLTEVLETAIEGVLDGLRVSLPGRIEAYNATTRRATVQVLAMDGHVNGAGERKATAIAPLTDVPVAHWGSGAIRIKVPVRKGDECWLLCSSSSIARLKATGTLTAYDPGDDRHHHLADAIAIPCVVVSEVDADAMIEFTAAGTVEIGGDEPLVTRAEFLSHTHATAATGTPSPPIIGGASGSDVTFPGTAKLRG